MICESLNVLGRPVSLPLADSFLNLIDAVLDLKDAFLIVCAQLALENSMESLSEEQWQVLFFLLSVFFFLYLHCFWSGSLINVLIKLVFFRYFKTSLFEVKACLFRQMLDAVSKLLRLFRTHMNVVQDGVYATIDGVVPSLMQLQLSLDKVDEKLWRFYFHIKFIVNSAYFFFFFFVFAVFAVLILIIFAVFSVFHFFSIFYLLKISFRTSEYWEIWQGS